MQQQSQNTWYIIAPHLVYPLRNGADLYADGVAKGMSYRADIVLIGAATIKRFRNGVMVSEEKFFNQLRSKLMATLFTLFTKRSYQESKFNTFLFRRMLSKLSFEPDANIAFSFISSVALADFFSQVKGYKVVLTHNFDIAYFSNLRDGLQYGLQKRAIDYTIEDVDGFLKVHQGNYLFAHNNESDRDNYARLYPKMQHALFKVGVDTPTLDTVLKIRSKYLLPGNVLRICFTGYLNGVQNLEALQHFESKFWPALQQAFGKHVAFYVIGSSPSQPLKEMVQRLGWNLRADLDDEQFTAEVASCHYSVLPFPYTSGTKHKLFTSVARGVPFLATSCIAAQADSIPESCLFSDDAAEWVDCIKNNREALYTDALVMDLHRYISGFSWQRVAADFFTQLETERRQQAVIYEDVEVAKEI